MPKTGFVEGGFSSGGGAGGTSGPGSTGITLAQTDTCSSFCPEHSVGWNQIQDENTLPTIGVAVWPVADTAILIPFWVPRDYTVTLMWWYNGATTAGNVEAGIYNASFGKVVTTGSQLHNGASAAQTFDITDTPLTAKTQYFFYMSMSNGTATVARDTIGSANRAGCMGLSSQASVGPGSAPSTFTPAAGSVFLPLVGISSRTIAF